MRILLPWLLVIAGGVAAVGQMPVPVVEREPAPTPKPPPVLDPNISRFRDSFNPDPSFQRKLNELQRLIDELQGTARGQNAPMPVLPALPAAPRIPGNDPAGGGYIPSVMPVPYAALEDAAVKEATRGVLMAKLKRDEEAYRMQVETFRVTSWISYFIFGFVHLLTFTGLVIAVLEFRQAGLMRGHKPDVSELTLKLDGLALKTALQGILLLALSISFYFLYLKFVYPITAVTL